MYPCMSYRPQGFGFFMPTGGSCPLEFSLNQQYSPISDSLANENGVVVPARQEYSHSASDGSRITSPSPSSLRARIRSVTFLQNSTASGQLTISTELRGPCHFAGFLPITAL